MFNVKIKVAAAHCVTLRYNFLTFLILFMFPVASGLARLDLLSCIWASSLSCSFGIMIINPRKGTQKWSVLTVAVGNLDAFYQLITFLYIRYLRSDEKFFDKFLEGRIVFYLT